MSVGIHHCGITKPMALNLSNNSSESERLQVKLFGQKCIVHDTVAPDAPKMNE